MKNILNFIFPFWVFLILFVIMTVYKGHSQVQKLGMDNGLSNNSVKSIYQDRQGYMWFGTSDGLNRYDGYEIKSYRNKLHNPNSIPHNYIYCVTEDLLHQIWIGTGQGVGIYDQNFDTFSRLRFHPHWDINDTQTLSADAKTIAVDTFNNIYVGTNGWGLFVKSTSEEVADWIPLQEKRSNKNEYYYHVSVVHVDKNNTIWVFIDQKGLFRYEPSHRKFHLMNDSIHTATDLLTDDKGNLLIANEKGLYVYDITDQKYILQFSSELRSASVEKISMDKDGHVWLATNNGVEYVDVKQKKLIGSYWNSHDYNSLSSNNILAIYVDEEQRKWIGTSKGGVNILDPSKYKFKTDDTLWKVSKQLPSLFVKSFLQTKSGELWIGTEGGGLGIWDPENDSLKILQKGEQGLTDNVINSTTQDDNGDIWLATLNGIQRFSESKGFKHYRCYTEKGEENKHIQIILKDDKNTLWAAAQGYGKLYRFNPAKDAFEIFASEENDINTLETDSEGNLWGGNYHELIKINKNTGSYKKYEIGKPVRSIYVDEPNHLWVGTEGKGLILFNRSTDRIEKTYADKEGLCNNSVLSIEKDNSGYLWLSTFDGLSRFNPKTEEFMNFDRSDGLQSNEFSYGASTFLENGKLAFGGVNGFNLFHPDSIVFRKNMPKLAITAIRINNRLLQDSSYSVQLDDEHRIRQITLPYNEATLSLNFVAFEFSSPHKILYQYKLEGLDKEWNMAGTTRAINYNNLREGSYTLLIKSTNSEGEWSNQTLKLEIKVLPPWYRSWWAYFIYIGTTLVLLRVYIQYRHRQTKLKYEVDLANFAAKKERELNEKRQSFFANVSHEFRTPLTLIVNPVKELLQNNTDINEKLKLNIIKRNTKRLLSLVDQLLLFHKAENDVGGLRMSRFEASDFFHEIYLCFQQQAQKQNIEYHFETNTEHFNIISDKEKLEIILYNLLSNAFKFTPEKGVITLRIKSSDTNFLLEVSDTGVGIPSEVGNNIYKKFYSDNNEGVKPKPGFGIGMHLSKTLIDMLEGKISYESTVNVGTTFTILLPKNNHLSPTFNKISEDASPSVIKELIMDEVSITDKENVEKTTPPNHGKTEIIKTTSLLIVDDNTDIRNYLSNLFKDEFNIFSAKNGEEALGLVKSNEPEIIISDIIMDKMNGIELCSKVKSDPKYSHIQIILLTSSPSDRFKLEGTEEGADAYIQKPFDNKLLRARVNAMVKNRKNLHQYFYNAITLQSNEVKISEHDKEFLTLCINIIEENINNEKFNVNVLSEEVGISYSSLYKKIKAISNKTVNTFIRDIKLRKAAKLFIDTDMRVNEVANATGFSDIKHFRVQFNKLFGINPSDYIKKYRKTFQNDYRIKK